MAQTEVPETDGPETDGAETDGTDVWRRRMSRDVKPWRMGPPFHGFSFQAHPSVPLDGCRPDGGLRDGWTQTDGADGGP